MWYDDCFFKPGTIVLWGEFCLQEIIFLRKNKPQKVYILTISSTIREILHFYVNFISI
jgi:hypothetical protein